jgi:hypothetical protein
MSSFSTFSGGVCPVSMDTSFIQFPKASGESGMGTALA